MSHAARILTDSISPDGVRLTSFELTYPRIIHAEMCRHRMHSRCVSSSRAIPIQRFIDQVENDPYIPFHWGKNQKGMQAEHELTPEEANRAEIVWLRARDYAVHQAKTLCDIGLHKQLTNRLLEPWMWLTEIVTATEWDNFFHLRCHPHAHPDIRKTAELMRAAMAESEPQELDYGQWHMPLIEDGEDLMAFSDYDPAALPMNELPLCSIGRCARVSYLTHDGRRDVAEDIALAHRLLENGHMSPFEQSARPMTHLELNQRCHWYVELSNGKVDWTAGVLEHPPEIGPPLEAGVLTNVLVKKVLGWKAFEGNFNAWMQYRKTIPNEHDIKGAQG